MEKHIIKFKETSREEELEFYSNIFLSEKRTEFNKIEETNEFPLIQQIFYLPFIKKVTLNKHSIYIEKLNILKWEDVQEELCSQLEEFLNKGGLVSKNEIKKVSPVTVYAESTPNPNAMKFVVNKKIVDDVYEFKSIDQTKDSPLAKSLFGFDFVKEADSGKVKIVLINFVGATRFQSRDTALVKVIIKDALNYPLALQAYQTQVKVLNRYILELKYSFLQLDKSIKKVKDKFNILAVFDDRDRVVDMWRSLGLTCLQVAYGKF